MTCGPLCNVLNKANIKILINKIMAWVTLQPGRFGSFEQRWLLLVVGEGDPEMPLLAAIRSRKLTKSHICLSKKELIF